MRQILLAGLILATTGAAQAQQTPPTGTAPPQRGHQHGHLFISPMGEPFRGDDPQEAWFNGADTNHDGALSVAEFEGDAARFFAALDRGHDGEIDPDDIEYYETVLVPEVRVGSSESDDAQTTESQGSGDDGASRPKFVYPTRQGAGRYGYFDYPEPVTIADRNFNRGVDPGEFRQAADDRFALLDINHDGAIRRQDLPQITSPSTGGGRHASVGYGGRGGHGRRRNHG